MSYVCIGVDPGLTGAIAIYAPTCGTAITVHDIPTYDKHVDAQGVRDIMNFQMHWQAQVKIHVAIENVASMPGQGVASTFKFGRSAGILYGVAVGLWLPVIFITPRKWKRHYALTADKEMARHRAIHEFPGIADQFKRKKDHNRAEACLLAKYAYDHFLKGRAL